ncbi:hypothetical protein ABZ729_03055 [Streptomyces sp. NPDC006678]
MIFELMCERGGLDLACLERYEDWWPGGRLLPKRCLAIACTLPGMINA